nr:hypothetical protein Iba_chr03cCG9000 [Ipomoea batatas]
MNMQRDKLLNRVGEGGENGGCAAVAELGRREISGGVWFTNFEYANRGIKVEFKLCVASPEKKVVVMEKLRCCNLPSLLHRLRLGIVAEVAA